MAWLAASATSFRRWLVKNGPPPITSPPAPAWTIDEADRHRILAGHEDNRDGLSGGLGRLRRRCVGDDHSHLASDEVGGEARQPIELIVRPTLFDRYVLAVDKPFVLQTLLECGQQMHERRGWRAAKKADHGQRRLLRARRERPDGNSTADERYELAPSHSITSSASASSFAGTSRPSALAATTLMTSSYLVGISTGKSLGFAPLRIRPT